MATPTAINCENEDTLSKFNALDNNPRNNAPKSAPRIDPRPPNKLTPPITAAAIA
jgi:hypothetical protein